ncbi:PRC-barrel domain-containing protein [Oceanobacillus rekensis]|uniref:PRC-barrel domain-containing protein n=1 Tax=Oceanobacillus rekensis TaxID=937927 RepID=UPI000B42D127|nr:PRC-barrel domain-containing protein [Oceanobacillus rekensis]
MQFYTTQLKNYSILAKDGEMGKIKDIYFNDQNWGIRYAIVDTRKWLPGRKVLLPPDIFINVNKDDKYVAVEYDKEMVRNSPPVPENEDLTKEQESNLVDYYGWNVFPDNALIGTERGPIGTFEPNRSVKEKVPEEPHLQREQNGDKNEKHLRSEDETIGFKVHAKDGKIGKLVDMIYDSEQWKINYIVVNSNENLLEEELYIYRVEQIKTVDWFEKDLYINDSVKGISSSKPFTSKDEIIASL